MVLGFASNQPLATILTAMGAGVVLSCCYEKRRAPSWKLSALPPAWSGSGTNRI